MRYAAFVETKTSRKMLLSLRSVRAACGITMIIASSGVGKTKTEFLFRDMEAPRASFLDVGTDQADQWGIACALCARLGLEEPNARTLAASRHRIAEEVGPDGILMLDEAQNLIRDGEGRGQDDTRTFEWLHMMQ
ncbi:ATP-binding protein [Sagittula salina]|uniref:ATP-binding protein n=1 Tax=Sagittula salina TaxID=2820268 RepID=A0A940MMN1_9RHOB|nr:ATP-binding protein [Sagittula salina]MBP0481486.1 ATP-binding protein [Sagittula salina]